MDTPHDGRPPGACANDRLQDPGRFSKIIGQSPRLLELFRLIEQVAASDANILIEGESGTGKELIADAIHARSRSAKPFVKINCAAIPAELIESELFGYRRGAFTGAALDRSGLLAQADNGSLLLDEIGEMPTSLQPKLLRVLQEREYRPIGSERTIPVRFRLLTATNTDIEQALRDARVREDLYFRINTIILKVPPLRERTEDIPLLCAHFVERFRQRHDKTATTVSPEAMSRLIEYPWPGNVRELENAIECGVLLCMGTEIGLSDLPESLRCRTTRPTGVLIPAACTLAEIEKSAILQTLNRTNWNRQQAAALLGLHRPTLRNKMRKHGLHDSKTIN